MDLSKKSELLIRLGEILDRIRVCRNQHWDIYEETIGIGKVVRDMVEEMGKEKEKGL